MSEAKFATAVGSPARTSVTTSASAAATAKPTTEKPRRARPEEFIFGKLIGEGSYSCVFLAKEVSTQREFAIKVCEKNQIIRENKSEYIHREKEIMLLLSEFNERRPYFVQLHSTFQVSNNNNNNNNNGTIFC
jgi:3-phosphoinositide dependent protein kinase-1